MCPRCSSDCYFHALWLQVVCMPSLQIQSNALQAVSQSSLLNCKTSDFKHCWLPEVPKFSSSHFPRQLLWGFTFPMYSPLVSLSLPCSVAAVTPQWPWFYSLPDCVSILSTFLDVAFSLHLVVEFVLPVPGQFLGYLEWFDSYLVIYMRQSKPRILLSLCHLLLKELHALLMVEEYTE